MVWPKHGKPFHLLASSFAPYHMFISATNSSPKEVAMPVTLVISSVSTDLSCKSPSSFFRHSSLVLNVLFETDEPIVAARPKIEFPLSASLATLSLSALLWIQAWALNSIRNSIAAAIFVGRCDCLWSGPPSTRR